MFKSIFVCFCHFAYFRNQKNVFALAKEFVLICLICTNLINFHTFACSNFIHHTSAVYNLYWKHHTSHMQQLINQLSPYLFWDCDRETVSVKQNASFIIQRVFDYGQLNDWNLIKEAYGINFIVDICKQMRTLPPQAVSFLCCLSGSKKEDFRCYTTKQSNPIH